MKVETRQRISDAQKARYDQLRALKRTHREIHEALILCDAVVRRCAEEHDDSLARYVVERLDAAWTSLEAENIAAADLLANGGPITDASFRRDGNESRP